MTGPSPLTDYQIEILVGRYPHQMARYEEVARLVEDRLRRALRGSAVRVLLSSRAKHPDGLRGKLTKKRDKGDARYTFAALEQGLNSIVTDLAGCRVLVYRPSDLEKAVHAAKSTFERGKIDLAPLGDKALEQHDKESGYRAVHLLLQIGEQEERESIRGAICEVQITSIASHVFSELEHDIQYKDEGHAPARKERDALDQVMYASRLLDPAVDRLVAIRAASVRRQTERLRDGRQLQFVLEQDARRPLRGDFSDLFKLLNPVLEVLTTSNIVAAFGTVEKMLSLGKTQAQRFGLPEDDDVIHVALALFHDNAQEFEELVRSWRGPSTTLKKAIVRAADERKKSS